MSFDAPAQLHLLDACDQLQIQPWVQRDPALFPAAASGRVKCVAHAFRAWVTNASGQESHSFGPTFPVPDGIAALRAFLRSSHGATWREHVGLANGELAFVSVSFDLAVRRSASRSQLQQLDVAVADFAAALNARAPSSLGPAVPSAGGAWAWMHAQGELASEATGGMLRTAAFAIMTVLVLSGSAPLAFFAWLASIGACVSLLSLLVACSWSLGDTEAVILCAAPAITTPAAAVLVRAYSACEEQRRGQRAAYAFRRVASPIISGSFAVALGTSSMLGCYLERVFKLELAVCFCAACVGMWVGVFLPALLATWGPEAAAPGLQPTFLSLPWLVVRRFGPQKAYVAERLRGYFPGSVAWVLAQRRLAREHAQLERQRAYDLEVAAAERP